MGSSENGRQSKYLSGLGAWALAFGCAVGWGAFVMPGTTFLPVAGPLGTAIGLGLGGVLMLVLGLIYHYLMNRYPDGGGTYTYTKELFGYDHAFVSAWFLILTYIAIIWANATALPLIARTLLGPVFQFGFHYEIAGFQCWFGEILLAECALLLGALICLRRRISADIQIVMALIMMAGVAVMAVMISKNVNAGTAIVPYNPNTSVNGGIFTVFSLAPWAYVGFESISHSAKEAKYPLHKTFAIIASALICAALAYGMLAYLGASAQPEGIAGWPEYISRLDEFGGLASMPTFFAANRAFGNAGSGFLGIVAVCGVFTGLIGNYIALSRLLVVMAKDGMLRGWIGTEDEHLAPRNALAVILGISLVLPFLGRTAISWIVDVTTVGATIAYAFASGSALKLARRENNRFYSGVGVAGLLISLLFAIDFLIPNITSVKTLSTESYLILATWGIMGFIFFRQILRRDKERRFGRSIVAWVVLLGLIIFTSSVWMLQSTGRSVEDSVAPIQEHYEEQYPETAATSEQDRQFIEHTLRGVNRSISISSLIQSSLIVGALLVLFDIYAEMQKREKQIEVEKALAEESSRAKTSFLSNMSHEIRTPMNAIIGLDNIALRNPDLDPKTRSQLEKIGASANHLLGLINDILDMSRIESGRMVLKNEEFAFREFLDQINIIINGQCLDKGLDYQCRIVGHVSDYFYGDDLKLKQILINILGNSVKFTEAPGSVTLTVEQLEGTEDMSTLRFTIRDTGIGMDKEYIPKIFEAFSQENATATNRYGGSGLGLAITKNFVEMMGGDILVESEKGVGSTFTVTVSLKNSVRNAEFRRPIELPANARAFVVDDDVIACEHAQVILQSQGIETDICSDPEEALLEIRGAYASGNPYLIVLTDYKMPQMSGMQFIEKLREFDGGQTLVIVTTGYNWDIMNNEERTDIADGIISKPLYSDSLMHLIHHTYARKKGVEDIAEDEDDYSEFGLAGRRILMAEDVEQNAEILEDLLMLEDMEAVHAHNGEEAVAMFSDHEKGYFDAILMDVRMPVMDGLTAAKTIRAMERDDAKKIPIIAMTANVFDEDVERSMQAGMNAHLSKPVEPERLYSTLQKLIATAEK